MFLSLIVPVYNTEKYLDECLNSFYKQDLPYNEYEVICINDGSTDSSLSILNSYQKQYPNITVIDKKNEGVSVARNIGIDIARGDYVWFIDSDDFIQDKILAKLKEVAENSESDRIITGFYCFNNYLTEEEQEKKNQHKLLVNSNQHDSVVTTSLFRRQYIIQHKLKFNYPDVVDGEDTIFMYEFKLFLPKTIDLKQPYYFYRRREDSAMTEKSNSALKRKQRSYLHNAMIMKGYYDKKGDCTDTANVLMNFLWLELFCLARMPLKEAIPYLNELKKAQLYPFRRPKACTLSKSYMTTRTDFIGMLFDIIYLNLHNRLGFWTMRIWNLFGKCKKYLQQVKYKLAQLLI